MYCRSPSGLLVELAWGPPDGFLIDETAAELGTHMCIPPHWEHRRGEIDQLEPIETEETVVS
jgi:glyoxalase family protein